MLAGVVGTSDRCCTGVLLVAVLRVIRDANPGQQVVRIGGAMMRETPDLHTGTAPMGLHADCGRCGESTWPTGGPLAPIDLLFSAAEIEEQLRLAIRERQWLDAYLLAAGLNQMVEDRLHPDPLQLRRAAGYLRGRGSRAARFGGRMSGAAAGLLRPFAVGSRSASLWRGRESLTEATIRLAGAVLDPEGVDPVIPAGLDTLQATVRALGADVVRVSTCFAASISIPTTSASWSVGSSQPPYVDAALRRGRTNIGKLSCAIVRRRAAGGRCEVRRRPHVPAGQAIAARGSQDGA